MAPGALLLRNGRCVRLRRLQAADASALQRFVSGLSAQARQMRFHVGLRELVPALLQQLTQVDQHGHVALAACVKAAAGASTIVAEARYVRLGRGPEAELALSVADDWQRLGLARQLLQRLMRQARRQGLRRLVGDVLWDNHAMLSMVRRLGGRLRVQPANLGVLRAQFEL
jgi:acetyltransferase